MIDRLDIRFGKVIDIRPFSDKPDSPRRKFCVIRVEFPGVGVRQSVGRRDVADLAAAGHAPSAAPRREWARCSG